jgi:hypothetical protein
MIGWLAGTSAAVCRRSVRSRSLSAAPEEASSNGARSERIAACHSAKPRAAAVGSIPGHGESVSIRIQLGELQLFSDPATLVLLTWDDLSADLLLVSRQEDQDIGLGDTTDAAPAGISAVLLPRADAALSHRVARLRSVPAERTIKLLRQDIVWDGKDFRVDVAERELPARATETAL